MKFIIAILLTLTMYGSFGQSMGLALEGAEWSGIQSLPVKGRNGILIKQKLSFGEYSTLEVDRSWTKGTALTKGLSAGVPTDEFYRKIITTDIVDKKQTLYFTLADGAGNRKRAFCMSHFHEKDFNIGNSPVSALNLLLDIAGKGGKSSNAFFVRIYGDDPDEAWELFLDNQEGVRNPKDRIGYLAKNRSDYYTIIPSTRIKSKKGKTGEMPFGSAGFEIRNRDGQALAAVSLIDKGIVYLHAANTKERLLLATACTALLLQEEAL